MSRPGPRPWYVGGTNNQNTKDHGQAIARTPPPHEVHGRPAALPPPPVCARRVGRAHMASRLGAPMRGPARAVGRVVAWAAAAVLLAGVGAMDPSMIEHALMAGMSGGPTTTESPKDRETLRRGLEGIFAKMDEDGDGRLDESEAPGAGGGGPSARPCQLAAICVCICVCICV